MGKNGFTSLFCLCHGSDLTQVNPYDRWILLEERDTPFFSYYIIYKTQSNTNKINLWFKCFAIKVFAWELAAL